MYSDQVFLLLSAAVALAEAARLYRERGMRQ